MTQTLSSKSRISTTPRVAAAGQAVFVVWVDDDSSTGEVRLLPPLCQSRRGTGRHPSTCRSSRRSRDGRLARADIAAEGGEVYVAWEDETNDSCPRVFGRRSKDQGSLSSWVPMTSAKPDYLAPGCPGPCMCKAFSPALAAAGPWVHPAFKSLTMNPDSLHAAYGFNSGEELPICQRDSASTASKLTTAARSWRPPARPGMRWGCAGLDTSATPVVSVWREHRAGGVKRFSGAKVTIGRWAVVGFAAWTNIDSRKATACALFGIRARHHPARMGRVEQHSAGHMNIAMAAALLSSSRGLYLC